MSVEETKIEKDASEDTTISTVELAKLIASLAEVVDPLSKSQREKVLNALGGLYGFKVVHKDAFVSRKPVANGFQAYDASANTSSGRSKAKPSKSRSKKLEKTKQKPKKSTFNKLDPAWIKIRGEISELSDKIAAIESEDDVNKSVNRTLRKRLVDEAKVLKIKLQTEQKEKEENSSQ